MFKNNLDNKKHANENLIMSTNYIISRLFNCTSDLQGEKKGKKKSECTRKKKKN